MHLLLMPCVLQANKNPFQNADQRKQKMAAFFKSFTLNYHEPPINPTERAMQTSKHQTRFC